MSMPQDFIGVDVSKDWIDVFHLSTSRHHRVAATKAALGAFADSATGALVICEASGGHERPLTDALAAAGTGCVRVNPRQAREFARATGRLAKTDRVDAAMRAEMGRALELAPTPRVPPERSRLAALVARRDDLVAAIGAEKNHAGQTADRWIAHQIASLIGVLKRHLAKLESEIAAQIEADKELACQHRRLVTMPGVGPVVSAVILARLPELGRLDRRRIASPAGLAGLRQRYIPRQTPYLEWTRRPAPRALYRRIRRIAIRPDNPRFPHPLARRRKTDKSRNHGLRKKAAHNPQRHGSRSSRLKKPTA